MAAMRINRAMRSHLRELIHFSTERGTGTGLTVILAYRVRREEEVQCLAVKRSTVYSFQLPDELRELYKGSRFRIWFSPHLHHPGDVHLAGLF
jgi:hypothetical protein